MRKSYDFNTDWLFAKTDQIPETLPEEGSQWEAVTLPHTWNAEDGQDGGNDYFRGTGMYVKKWNFSDWNEQIGSGERIVLEFPAAAMIATVYVNGKKLAYHEGGYSAFRVDMTGEVQEAAQNGSQEVLLCVAVDNSANDRVYPQKADFTFYGGLYRGAKLLFVPKLHFEHYLVPGGEIKITPQVEGEERFLLVESWQPAGVSVSYRILEKEKRYRYPWETEKPRIAEKIEVVGEIEAAEEIQRKEDGSVCITKSTAEYVAVKLRVVNAKLWNGMREGFLYELTITLSDGDTEGDSLVLPFAFRTFSFDPEKGFILNGKPYPLRGVSRHQDRQGVGNALTLQMHEEDMELIWEMGANTIRLAHYQQAQEFYDLADRYGMVVWAEIPYITEHMPNGRENTLSQMRELITQCYHHPSIVCWGLSNEITASGSVTEDMLENHRLLNDLCHQLDPTRPTTMAHVFMLETDSPITKIPDIASYNLYFGWYLGELSQNDQFFDEYHAKFPDRCIGFSEYGADANLQFQTATPEVGDYTEQYQACYHEHILQCIEERPYLWATHVWNMFDFAADGRDEGGAHGLNQKGLITFDRKVKKDIFYLYQAYWNGRPLVHICGKRYVDRTESVTEIKVYSSLPEVNLYVDGELFATQKVEEQKGVNQLIYRFQVPISGEHEIEATAIETVPWGRNYVYRDKFTLRFVTEANPSYRFQKEAIVNWFDREELDASCYSIRDTMGELTANPETAKLLEAIMAKATASRGDVAESTRGNANLQKMMAAMPMERLLKQAGEAITAEEIRAFNQELQKIKKNGTK